MVQGTNETIDPLIINNIQKTDCKTVFDYGCGYTDLVWKIHSLGKEVVGFDINDNYIDVQRKKNNPGGIRFIDSISLKKELLSLRSSFDCVVCNLVLCDIDINEELEQVIVNIVELLCTGGIAIIGICNPLATFSGSSLIQRRVVPEGVTYSDQFEFKKEIFSTGNIRSDFHRPLGVYENLFDDKGLKIISVEQSSGIDFMVFYLEKGDK